MEPISLTVKPLPTFNFNGHELVVVEWRGKQLFFAKAVGEALEYADPSNVARFMAGKWKLHLREGTDVVTFTGDDLAALKVAVNSPRNRTVVDPRAPQITLLTFVGVQVVAAMSRTAKGDAFRWWVADEVVPTYLGLTGERAVPLALTAEQEEWSNLLPAPPQEVQDRALTLPNGLDRDEAFREYELACRVEKLVRDARSRADLRRQKAAKTAARVKLPTKAERAAMDAEWRHLQLKRSQECTGKG